MLEGNEWRLRSRWLGDRSGFSAGSTRVGGVPERPRPLETVERRLSARWFGDRSGFSAGSTRVGGAPERPRPLETVELRSRARWFADRSAVSPGSTRAWRIDGGPRPLESVERRLSARWFGDRSAFSSGSTGRQSRPRPLERRAAVELVISCRKIRGFVEIELQSAAAATTKAVERRLRSRASRSILGFGGIDIGGPIRGAASSASGGLIPSRSKIRLTTIASPAATGEFWRQS